MELGKEYAPAYELRSLPAVWVIVLGFGFATGIYAGMGYSYWFDELATIAQVSLPFTELFETVLFDVHPPLYPVLMKVWASAFGVSEVATRSLSAIFGIAAVATFATNVNTLCRDQTERLAAVAFFVCAWPVIFYSNETRAYSLLLLLGCVAFFRIYRGRIDGITHAALLLLSLTHYFGTLAAGLIYASIGLSELYRGKLSLKTMMTGAAVLVWPVIHVTFGEIGSKTGGKFWIESQPLGAFGLLVDLFAPYMPLTRAVSIVGLLAVAVTAFYRGEQRICSVAAFVFLYLLVAALIDLHTPITTARNLIVLVPAVAFALPVFALRLCGRWALLILAPFTLSMLYCTADKLTDKAGPLQPNKELFQLAYGLDLSPLTYYIEFGLPQEVVWAHRIFNVYADDEITLFTGCDDGPVYILQMHSADDVAVPGCEYSVVEALDHRTRIVLAEPAG